MRMIDVNGPRSNWATLTHCLTNPFDPNIAYYTDKYAKHPGFLDRFPPLMNSLSLPAFLGLSQKFPWENYSTFADIGGSAGFLAAKLCAINEHLKGIVADLPLLKEKAEGYLNELNLANKVNFIGLDFFQDALPKADVLIFGHVLMDWPEEEKIILLKKAYDALDVGDVCIVYDHFIDNKRKANIGGLLMSLHMQITTMGHDFTFEQCKNWFKQVGFTNILPSINLNGPIYCMWAIKQ